MSILITTLVSVIGEGLQIPDIVDVHVIAGQSNAQGPETGAPTDGTLINPAGFIMGKEFLNSTEVNEFERILYPINNLTNQASLGHAIELKLAKQYYEDNNKALCIIKVVKGGSSLFVDWASNSDLRDALISYINLANTKLLGKTITWKGFYWNQGETDAGNITYANAYQANLEDLILEIRNNTPLDNTTKIIAVRPHIDGAPGLYLSTVRTAIENASIVNYEWLNCDDVSLVQPNDIHYNSDGQNLIAQRYYNEIYS